MNGVPAVPAVNNPARQKRLDAAILQRKKARRRPFYFVMLTLGAWWLLAVLADIVITCTPGGPPCRAPQIADSIGRLLTRDRWGEFSQAGATAALSKYEWPLLLLALLAALWVAKAAVYPDTDATSEFSEDELAGKKTEET
jgi:hypothetical protein